MKNKISEEKNNVRIDNVQAIKNYQNKVNVYTIFSEGYTFHCV